MVMTIAADSLGLEQIALQGSDRKSKGFGEQTKKS
jgi:hypothetical protein